MKYIGVSHMRALVNEVGIETFLRELAEYIEADYKRWDEFEKTPRIANHAENGVIELMPISDKSTYAFKYVNGHPKNFEKGLQTVTAFGALAEMETGYPVLLSEMTIATALRTAATSALVAKYLAREDARSMAMIGNGCQAEFQALAFKALLGVTHLRLFDIDMGASQKLIKNLQGKGFELELCESAEEAVKRADIITVATADKKRATIVTDNMVGAGVHINGVGGDCPGKTEIAAAVLSRARTFVEFEPQTRIEGDTQQMPEEYEVTELWQLFEGNAAGRTSPDQITFFDSVGFALEDYSTLRYLHDKSEGTQFFGDIDLLAVPENPKNLFGELS